MSTSGSCGTVPGSRRNASTAARICLRGGITLHEGCFDDGAAAMLALRGTAAGQRERLTWRARAKREVSPRSMARLTTFQPVNGLVGLIMGRRPM